MESKTSNKYTLTFRDIKEKFPEIKGDLIEMSFDDKSKTLVIDTTSSFYEDQEVIIHKEIVSTFKDVYRIRDKRTNSIAEGSTEKEAMDRLQELINTKKNEAQNGTSKQ